MPLRRCLLSQHMLLGASGWRVFGRPDHPAFESWSAAAWAQWPHLQIRTGSGEPGPVDRAAASVGLSRTIGAVIPQFAMAPAILARTDLLLTVPRMALHGLIVPHGLAERLVPFEIPAMPLALYWSAVFGGEGAVRWFRRRVEHVLHHTLDDRAPVAEADAS